jgi:hypothetical protein
MDREIVKRLSREEDGWGCTLTLVKCESEKPQILEVNCRFATDKDLERLKEMADEVERETGNRPDINVTLESWRRVSDPNFHVPVHWFITAEDGVLSEQVERAIQEAQSAFEKKGAKFVVHRVPEFDSLDPADD